MSKRGKNPNSLKNLKPLNQRPETERKQIQRKGGIASGKARRDGQIVMTLKTTEGTIFTVKGSDYKRVADALAELEKQLYKKWHEEQGKE